MMFPDNPPTTQSWGRQLIIASKAFAHEQPLKSWYVLISTVLVFALAIAVAALPLLWPIRILASILAGLVMVRLFILYHDHQHGTILKGSRFANGFMWIYGILTLNPPSIWNRSHNHHHRNTAKILGADIGSFPIMTTENYARAGRWQKLLYGVSRHPLTMVAGYLTIFLYGMCIRSLFIKPREHWDSAVAIVAHSALVAAIWIFFGPVAMLMTLLIPSAIAACLGAYLFYAQHNYPGVILQPRAQWDYVTAALKSSSYIRMNRIMHWFTGNIGYHHVHHLNHHIPFYRLPEAMDALPELQSPGTTSLSPADIYRCLRLKLWDADANALVPFSAAQAAEPTPASPSSLPLSLIPPQADSQPR